MPNQVSLNTLQPDQVAHGTEISIQVNGVTIGEIYEIEWEENEHLSAITTLGSRIIGRRQGVYEIKGTIKSWWINLGLREVVCGKYPVTETGQPSSIYHSQRPFQRYDFVVVSTNPKTPTGTLKNVVVESDKLAVSSEKEGTDDIAFFAEDFFGA